MSWLRWTVRVALASTRWSVRLPSLSLWFIVTAESMLVHMTSHPLLLPPSSFLLPTFFHPPFLPPSLLLPAPLPPLSSLYLPFSSSPHYRRLIRLLCLDSTGSAIAIAQCVYLTNAAWRRCESLSSKTRKIHGRPRICSVTSFDRFGTLMFDSDFSLEYSRVDRQNCTCSVHG